MYVVGIEFRVSITLGKHWAAELQAQLTCHICILRQRLTKLPMLVL